MRSATLTSVIIIGSGPAGYTAALYTARANLNPLVIEGYAWGGLLQQTTNVENYPGFPEGIMGPEMMQKFRDQAERFGARLLTAEADRVELADELGGIHHVWVGNVEHRARTLVLAMGAEHKKLGVGGEEQLAGRGISYCATCDAAFFRDAPTIIVGGGDSAMEEAIFLSKFASHVTVVHRRDEFRASKIMLDRARAQTNIEFLTPYKVTAFVPGESGALGHAALVNTETGQEREIPISGSFIAIGHEPPIDARARPDRPRREQLCDHARRLHAHQPARRVRGRRPGRSHLPAGHHGRQAAAARPRSMPSGTCVTRPACRSRRRCRRAIPPGRSGRRSPTPPRKPHSGGVSAPSSSSRKRLRSSPPP